VGKGGVGGSVGVGAGSVGVARLGVGTGSVGVGTGSVGVGTGSVGLGTGDVGVGTGSVGNDGVGIGVPEPVGVGDVPDPVGLGPADGLALGRGALAWSRDASAVMSGDSGASDCGLSAR
jgi:hypothetical protein